MSLNRTMMELKFDDEKANASNTATFWNMDFKFFVFHCRKILFMM